MIGRPFTPPRIWFLWWSGRRYEHACKRPTCRDCRRGFWRLSCRQGPQDITHPAEIVLIDRANHNVFQPLLYQVATAAVLAVGQIGSPIRNILRKQQNTTVILGEVTGVDKDKKCIFVEDDDRTGDADFL